jgi:hypothetical protein
MIGCCKWFPGGNRDFHRRNQDDRIFTLSKTGLFKFVPVNHTFGMSITHDAAKKVESDKCRWQQSSMSPQIHQVNRNINVNAMRNRWFRPRGSINKSLTGCLQRYIVLGDERNRTYLLLNMNNIALQIISWEHNFDFHRRNRDTVSGQNCRRGIHMSTCQYVGWSMVLNGFPSNRHTNRTPAPMNAL